MLRWGLLNKLYASVQYTHKPVGIPLEILADDFWVPSSSSRYESAKYNGQQQFQEILTTSEETAVLWAQRAVEDSNVSVEDSKE